ncbi:MAG: SgcJ/EcaC family oxidoreductase [Actinobacteria bacterium]|nr:SgcJ/EcaC family oxidoreductase [Actinomycetota bacterium]
MSADPVTVAAGRLEHMEHAWNRADGAGFAEVFADDTDFVDIRGAHHRGRTAVGAGHQALFDSIYAGSSVRFELEAAREVSPGCIVAIATSTLDAPTGPLQGINHARFTAAITEDGGRWSVVAFHNTLMRETD